MWYQVKGPIWSKSASLKKITSEGNMQEIWMIIDM